MDVLGILRENGKDLLPEEIELLQTELEERGYLKRADGRVTLTDRGIDVSNRVLAYFLL